MRGLWMTTGSLLKLITVLVVLWCVESKTPFIVTPPDLLKVDKGSNVSLRWEYYSGKKASLIKWGKVDKNDTFELVIATRESDRPPLIKPPYKERVLIVGQATLLLIGVKSSDGGRYSCQLLFQGQDSPVSNVAKLEIRESTTENEVGDDEKPSKINPIYIAFVAVVVILICLVILYVFLGYRKRGSHGGRKTDSSNHVYVESEEAVIRDAPYAQEMYSLGEPADQYNDVESEVDAMQYCVIPPPMLTSPAVKDWEFPREKLILLKVIGKGAFGQIAKGIAQGMEEDQENRLVATKMLKRNATEENERELLAELAVMKSLEPHPNVIKLLGCITKSAPLVVIIEYVPHGDLLGYLRKSRGLQDNYFNDPDTKPSSSLSPNQLFSFALDIAKGMEHLSSHKIIHRDLAARNVLVGEGEVCKITDFGMAKDIQMENVYKRTTAGRLPVKWTAIESLLYGTSTSMSDVWSYAVVLYEIFTIGGSPYPNYQAKAIVSLLEKGHRMTKPVHLDDKLYQVMQECWQTNPDDRPSFSELRQNMNLMGANGKDYLNLSTYDSALYQSLDELDV